VPPSLTQVVCQFGYIQFSQVRPRAAAPNPLMRIGSSTLALPLGIPPMETSSTLLRLSSNQNPALRGEPRHVRPGLFRTDLGGIEIGILILFS
jgi:hypothetical protein